MGPCKKINAAKKAKGEWKDGRTDGCMDGWTEKKDTIIIRYSRTEKNEASWPTMRSQVISWRFLLAGVETHEGSSIHSYSPYRSFRPRATLFFVFPRFVLNIFDILWMSFRPLRLLGDERNNVEHYIKKVKYMFDALWSLSFLRIYSRLIFRRLNNLA